MEPRDDHSKNIEKLFVLLQKILKNQGDQPAKDFPGVDLNSILNSGQKQINLNLCFFTFIPMSMDEMEDLEESFEDIMSTEERGHKDHAEIDLKFELNSTDMAFLKTNGIKF